MDRYFARHEKRRNRRFAKKHGFKSYEDYQEKLNQIRQNFPVEEQEEAQ